MAAADLDDATLPASLIKYAARHPDKILYTWLNDAGEPVRRLSYADVLLHVRAIARRLSTTWGLDPGDRAILVYPPGLDFIVAFLACLHAGIVAVPVYPPDLTARGGARQRREIAKFTHVVADARPSAVLSSRMYLRVARAAAAWARVRGWFGGGAGWSALFADNALPWHATDGNGVDSKGGDDATPPPIASAHEGRAARPGQRRRLASVEGHHPVVHPYEEADLHGEGHDAPADDADALAFLQYTSGSTADPKGVMVPVRALTHNVGLLTRHFLPRQSCAWVAAEGMQVSWLPPYHDMGLLAYLVPLFVGGTGVYLSPLAFVRDPLLWLRVISRHRGTHAQAPDFAFALCARRARAARAALAAAPRGSAAQRDAARAVAAIDALDLSSLVHVLCGAEPVLARSMRAFVAAFAANGFDARALLPAYGLAEHTVFVTGGGGAALAVDRASLAAPDGVVRRRRPARRFHITSPTGGGGGHGRAESAVSPRNAVPLSPTARRRRREARRAEAFFNSPFSGGRVTAAASTPPGPAAFDAAATGSAAEASAATVELVSVGRPPPGVSVAIVACGADAAAARRLPELRVGEVWVGSASLARGYWGRPGATARAFVEAPWNGRRYVRTGDRGFLHRGELFVTGRSKDLLIVRGRNHAAADVEDTARAACPRALRPGAIAAFAAAGGPGGGGAEAVVIAAEVRAGHGEGEGDRGAAALRGLARRVRRAVAAAHGLAVRDVVLVRPHTLPKTTSGKLQRYKCRRRYDRGAPFCAADRLLLHDVRGGQATTTAEQERQLEEREGDVGVDVARLRALPLDARTRAVAAHLVRFARGPLALPDVAESSDLFECGLDSLRATQLHAWCAERFGGGALDFQRLVADPTPLAIARAIASTIDATGCATSSPASPRRAPRRAASERSEGDAGRGAAAAWSAARLARAAALGALGAALAAHCHAAMAARNLNWWAQPAWLFRRAGVEDGFALFGGRLRDVGFHVAWADFVDLTLAPFACVTAALVVLGGSAPWRRAVVGVAFAVFFLGSKVFLALAALAAAVFVACTEGAAAWALCIAALVAYHGPWGRAGALGRALGALPLVGAVPGRGAAPELTVAYVVMRLVSFGVDRAQQRSQQASAPRPRPTLAEFFAFVFYPPLVVGGAGLTFASFQRQVRAGGPPRRPSAAAAARAAAALLGAWLALEAAMHTFYFPSLLFASTAAAAQLRLTAAEKLFYAMAHVFCTWLGSKVIYDAARLAAALDGVALPADMPRNVFAISASFHAHWRLYHASWNLWLVRYVFFPVGGGYAGLVLASGFSWLMHGFSFYWTLGAAVNIAALCVERWLAHNTSWYAPPRRALVRSVNHLCVLAMHVLLFSLAWAIPPTGAEWAVMLGIAAPFVVIFQLLPPT